MQRYTKSLQFTDVLVMYQRSLIFYLLWEKRHSGRPSNDFYYKMIVSAVVGLILYLGRSGLFSISNWKNASSTVEIFWSARY